jgi:serine/threonine-protein kinase
VAVPDLSGRTRDEAAQILQDAELALGDVSEQQTSDERMVGKVIAQDPKAGTKTAPGSKVGIVIGVASVAEKSAQAVAVKTPDVSGRTRDEAAQILQDAELALGDVSEQQASDEQMAGKVIAQDPKAGTEIAPGGKVAVTIGTAG